MYSVEESKKIWDENAEFWDMYMSDDSNDFHRNTVRPKVTELLNIQKDDYILDIACGNGNYSAFLAQHNIPVLAFDYSDKMIELARKRREKYKSLVEFTVADATDAESLKRLRRKRPFTKAVSCMALMDIADLSVLFNSVYNLLDKNGIFVFATQHPCFVTGTERYMTPYGYYEVAIENQPKKQCCYHRSMQDLFAYCFNAGFSVNGFYEVCFGKDKEIPEIIIVRAKKSE